MKKTTPHSNLECAIVSRRAGSFFLLSALLLFFISRHASAKTIIAEGVGYNENAAVRSALRSAVEQGVGMRISSETLVKNFRAVSDKILSRTDGYARSWSILSSSGEFGLVKVRVSADVAMDSLEKDLVAQKLLYEMANKPRIMLLFDERVDGTESFEKTAMHKFEEALLRYGFKVVEPEQFKENSEISRAKGLGDKDLASLGFRTGADLIIRGQVNAARATPKAIYGAQFYSVPVQINAHIVKTDDAGIIVSKTKRVTKNSQAEASAANFGLEVGGAALAEELIGELVRYWQSEAYNETQIEVVISGCPEKELANAESALRAMPDSRALRLRYIEGASAVYDWEISGSLQDVRVALDKKPLPGLSISSLSGHRIQFSRGAPQGGIIFQPQAPVVDVTALSVEDIFPSRLRYYENHPLVRVALTCGPQPLNNITIAVSIPTLMEMPSEKKVKRLDEGLYKDSLALVLLPGKLLAESETRTVNAKAVVSFSGSGGVKEKTLIALVKVHEPNAMDWRQPQAIGSFVTFRDPDVNALARAAAHAIPEGPGMNRGLLVGMALFEAIRARDISYVSSPVVAPGAVVLDHVSFPYQTLASRTGNCAGLSVLYAAMLSAVGIKAAIISYTDHVLVMFDTGIFEKNRNSLAVDPTLAVAHNGTLWIPVETTLLKKNFNDAWHTAASEFNTAVSEGQPLGIIDLDNAWKSFEPASIPQHPGISVPAGLDERVRTAVQNLTTRIRAELGDAVRKTESHASKQGLSPEETARLQTKLGILKARSNDPAGALANLKHAFEAKSSIGTESNYACALLVSGDDKAALTQLDKIYKQDESGRVAVNRALCLYTAASDSAGVEAFVSALKEAAAMMPSNAALAAALGISLDNTTDLKAAGDHEKDRLKAINLRRLKELIRKRVLSSGGADTLSGTSSESSTGAKIGGTTTESSTGSTADRSKPMVMPFGGIRGADPDQIAKIIDLLCWFEE